MSSQPSPSPSQGGDAIELQEQKPPATVESGVDGSPPPPHLRKAANFEGQKAVAISSLVTDAKSGSSDATAPGTQPPAPGAKSGSTESVVEKASFGELYHFATGFDKICVAISCVMMAGTGITLTMSMIILGNVLDGLNDPSKLLAATRLAALNFLIVGLVAGTAAAIGNGLPILAAERQMKRAREAYFAAVLRQDSQWFDTVKSGEMAANLAENSITWKTGIAEKFPQIFQGLATLCAGLGLGFHYSWQLTLLVLSIAPAVAILGGIIAFASGSLEKLATDALGEAGSCAMEVLNSIRIVVAYGGQRQETQRYASLVEKVKQAYMRKGWWVAAGLGAFFMCMFSAYAYTMYVGGVLIRRDRVKAYCLPPVGPTDECLTGGRVVQTFFVVITALFSLGQTVPGLVALASAQVAAAKMLKVIRRVPAIDSSSPDGLKTPIEGRIEFRDVSFAYPSRLDVPILSNFNLVIEKGQSVAFVGPSGSGKSTIVALVLRMYDPQSGCILIDGKNIREYNVVHLRSALGLVSQDPQLFSLSVSQNIALGKQDQTATQEEIVAAARAANADSFVSALPDRYNTIVGTSVTSSQLSGGQRQRICIARCLIRKPCVMLFDEATSALDTESEVAVQSSIDSLLSSSLRPTSLIIAHRLSTIVNSNVICVIDHGRIAQCGTHAQLMGDPQGLYHHLQSLQQIGNVDAGSAESFESTSAPPSPSLAPVDSAATPARRISDESSPDAARRASNDTPTAAETAITVGQTSAANHAPVPESRVWAMQKTEMNAIVAALAFSLINGGANTLVGLILAKAIAAFYLTDSDMESELIKTVGYFMAVAVGMFFANTFGKGFFCLAGEALSARLRAMTFSHILQMEMGFFDENGHSAGSLETRLSADAGLVKGATGEALSQVVSSAGGLAVGVIVAMQASWRIGLIILGTVPCTVLGGYYMTLAFMGTNKADKEALEKSGHIASEAATAIRTVSSLNLQSWMLGKFSLDTADRFVAAKAGAWRYSASSWFGFFNMQAVNALAWYVGGVFIDQGVLTFGELMQAFFAMQFAAMTIQQAFSFGPEKAKAVVAIESIFNILDRPSSIDPSAASGASPALCRGRIEFQNVTFSYPSRPDRRVLDGFSCVIEAGQSVALVGQSGCGKSSIIALLLRFYDPQSGVILLDGTNISTLNLNWLRSQFGYVQQEPALFDNTIEYNIHYGHPEPTQTTTADNVEVSADVLRAARQANALEFIETMPKKFGTECGARGSQLSGGQKQRIAIARMLLRGAPIILLDEATSALDSESELVVQKVNCVCILLSQNLTF